jgi:hypothetical protein
MVTTLYIHVDKAPIFILLLLSFSINSEGEK